MAEKIPTTAELLAAGHVIERAEQHVRGLMKDAGIPGSHAYIHPDEKLCWVNLSSSERVFLNSNGRRNLRHGVALFSNVEEKIAEVGRFLAGKAAA